MNFKIAVVQQQSYDRQISKNLEIIEQRMKQASQQKADLLLLPEAFITGYNLPFTNEEAIDDESEVLSKLGLLAIQYRIGLVATAITKGKEKPQNSAYLIDDEGQIVLKYSKVHTCDFGDENCLESGDEFYVAPFKGVKLGIMICYDREYPESARELMLKGAEIILVPNDCGSMRPRLQALSTRAYENMVGIVMANPNGTNKGNSCAYSPICWDKEGNCLDNTLLLGDESSEELYYVSFDLDKLRDYRSKEMMGNTFRKVKAYADLLNAKVEEPFIRLKRNK